MSIGQVMLDKMLESQRLANMSFINMEIVKNEVESTYNLDVDKELLNGKVSDTSIRKVGNDIELCRFINSKLYRVKFACEGLLVKDLLNWWEVKDSVFLRCCKQ